MLILTETAKLICQHELGVVQLAATQTLVRIDGRRVLVEPNPEGRPIRGCPNYGPTIKPCGSTLRVQGGYSDLLRISGKRVCLETVTGFTDGTPPGAVRYQVSEPGQAWVREGT